MEPLSPLNACLCCSLSLMWHHLLFRCHSCYLTVHPDLPSPVCVPSTTLMRMIANTHAPCFLCIRLCAHFTDERTKVRRGKWLCWGSTIVQLPLATPLWVPWSRDRVLLVCASAAHRTWHVVGAPPTRWMMNDCLAKSMSSSWSKPYLNCSGLPAHKRFLLFHVDAEWVQPREESSVPAPERPWRPLRPLSPGNVGVGGRSLPSLVFVSVDYLPVQTASGGEWSPKVWGRCGDFCLRRLQRLSWHWDTGSAWPRPCRSLTGDRRHGHGDVGATAHGGCLVNLGACWTRREGCWLFGGCREVLFKTQGEGERGFCRRVAGGTGRRERAAVRAHFRARGLGCTPLAFHRLLVMVLLDVMWYDIYYSIRHYPVLSVLCYPYYIIYTKLSYAVFYIYIILSILYCVNTILSMLHCIYYHILSIPYHLYYTIPY